MSRKIYLKEDVVTAAERRIEWILREFKNVVVEMSGGKDSTVSLYLTLKVAERMGRIPISVLFIDQEVEWQTVIDYIRRVMHDERVKPYWLQCPIKIFNATSYREEWLKCWDPKAEMWMRDREPDSIHDNYFGTDRFAKMFEKFLDIAYPDEPVCYIAGVRCEESPARYMGLTSYETYKGETWGSKTNAKKQHFTFYPLYDWSYRDIWKAIHDNDWPYCPIYDYMYQYGIPVKRMRVSNLTHETAVRSLYYLQEVEAETWEKATKRIAGINTAGQLNEQWAAPRELPYMFNNWTEYRDHLLNNLITDETIRERMRKQFENYDERFQHDPKAYKDLVKTEINAVINNDYHGTKLTVFEASHLGHSKNRGQRNRQAVYKQ